MKRIHVLITLLVCLIFVGGIPACSTLALTADVVAAMSKVSATHCLDVGPGLYTPAGSLHYGSFGGGSVGTAGGGGTATCGKSTITFNNEGKAVSVTGTPVKEGTVLKNVGSPENPVLIKQ